MQDDSRNSGLTDLKLSSDGFLTYFACVVQLSNFSYLCRSQIGVVMLFPAHWIDRTRHNGSSFANHIRAIISMRTHKQMAWPDTGGIIAFVTYDQSFGDRSKMQLPSKAVSANMFPVCKQLAVPASSDIFVDPTASCFLDSPPKSSDRFAPNSCHRFHRSSIAQIGEGS